MTLISIHTELHSQYIGHQDGDEIDGEYDGDDDSDDDDSDDDDIDDEYDGLPAYSHRDKIPPWWEYVSNDKGGNVSLSKSHHTW